MARSGASTVEEYLEELPPERRELVRSVRDLVRRHLPDGYVERINWGMISYEIPLERYPRTYNKQPLAYIGLASQKQYCALYLNSVYQDAEQEARLRAAFTRAGKTLDIGKSCVRFRALDDLALDAIGEVVAATPPDAFIARYEASRAR